MSQVFIGNGSTSLPERLDDSGNLNRVPYQDGVGYKAQEARFVHDLPVIPGEVLSLVGEKNPVRRGKGKTAPPDLFMGFPGTGNRGRQVDRTS